jgi:hypothetical protein
MTIFPIDFTMMAFPALGSYGQVLHALIPLAKEDIRRETEEHQRACAFLVARFRSPLGLDHHGMALLIFPSGLFCPTLRPSVEQLVMPTQILFDLGHAPIAQTIPATRAGPPGLQIAQGEAVAQEMECDDCLTHPSSFAQPMKQQRETIFG